MIKIANAQFWVHDQDEALRFYVGTLGWEVRSDVSIEEWSFRWLVVGPVGQPEVGASLRDQYEVQGHPYYASARLWDDGVIDPRDTRDVLGLALGAAANAPLRDVGYGVFRM